MKEIREIFETVRTYCGMMFGENRAAKSVMGNTESILAPMAGERICGRTECNESGKRADGAKCDKFRRAAFTLAEVLITLGIIGVVAALTLPTLIQNHQKQVYVTQLKKAYSTLNNAINKMAVDEGVVDWAQTQCGYQSNAFSVESTEDNPYPYINPACTNNLAKQMNVLKVEADYFADCPEWCVISGGTNGPAIMTADGITYQFDCSGFGYAYVDVNGIKKGPNKVGRDVFLFGIDSTDNKIIPDGSDHDSWKNCSATNLSTSCTAKVLIEGKMNY